MTDAGAAAAAVAAGADAVGLVFHPPSSRFVELAQAAAVAEAARAAGPFTATVAVLVNPEAATVRAIIDQVGPSHLQFHGEEADDFCAGFGVPYIKALRVAPGADLRALENRHPSARGVLLDTHRDGVYGGSGETFDWRRANYDGGARLPLILAGGLDAGNVAQALAQVKPYAVDVSSGVETGGRKDAAKIRAFCQAVAAADAASGSATAAAADENTADTAAA